MKKTITVDAVCENLQAVQESLAPVLLDCPFSPGVRMDLEIAVEEIFLNVASYAYAPGTGQVTIEAETDGQGIVITFIDSGTPFNPLETPEPDVNVPWQERKVGGLGLFMVRQRMDAMEYERRDGCNVLCIRKSAA